VIGQDRTVRWRSVDNTVARVSADGVLAYLRGESATPPPRKLGFPALRDWLRASINVARHGLRTPHS